MVASGSKSMPAPFGPYRLLRTLGTGGTAEVFLAENTGVQPPTRVIVKRLLPELCRYQEAIDAFLDEARLALKFTHPNVRRVHDFGQIGSDYYMTMEYVRGVCLADLVGAKGLPDLHERAPGALLRVVIDVCAALEHVHEQGVVHGDVNPRNVLVAADGTAKLTDFGCAIEGGDAALAHAVRGTHAYMSPEQVRGQPMDRRSDVFSVGVLLWELVSGKRLFRRPAQHLTLVAVVEDAVPPLGEPLLDRVLSRALAKRPDDRYPNTGALAGDLEAAAEMMELDAAPEALAAAVALLSKGGG
jgi:serine/threonine-protein kinase